MLYHKFLWYLQSAPSPPLDVHLSASQSVPVATSTAALLQTTLPAVSSAMATTLPIPQVGGVADPILVQQQLLLQHQILQQQLIMRFVNIYLRISLKFFKRFVSWLFKKCVCCSEVVFFVLFCLKGLKVIQYTFKKNSYFVLFFHHSSRWAYLRRYTNS